MKFQRFDVQTNNVDTFISFWDTNNFINTDEIIDFFKSSDFTSVGNLGMHGPNKRLKDSLDLSIDSINPPPVLNRLLATLGLCLNDYLSNYEFANKVAEFKIREDFNIQFYKPGSAYWVPHFERANAESSCRHLVWMVYLNDVDDGGETHFFYQDVKIKPKAGRVVIWPTDWTHTHRGLPSASQEKYIATGWYGF